MSGMVGPSSVNFYNLLNNPFSSENSPDVLISQIDSNPTLTLEVTDPTTVRYPAVKLLSYGLGQSAYVCESTGGSKNSPAALTANQNIGLLLFRGYRNGANAQADLAAIRAKAPIVPGVSGPYDGKLEFLLGSTDSFGAQNNPKLSLILDSNANSISLGKNQNDAGTTKCYLPGDNWVTPYNAGDISYFTAGRANLSGSTNFFFRVYNSGAIATPFVITSTGYVGIGLTNPSATLHINGFAKLTPLASAPSSPTEGMVYYDLTLHKLRVYTTTWENLH